MIVYSFDVGEQTGVSKYDTVENSVVLQTITLEELSGLIQDKDFNPGLVIIERMPNLSSVKYMIAISEIIKFCKKYDVKYELISPGQWKPLAKARRWKCLAASTDHESDSYLMLRYYSFTKHHLDLGDL